MIAKHREDFRFRFVADSLGALHGFFPSRAKARSPKAPRPGEWFPYAENSATAELKLFSIRSAAARPMPVRS